MASLIKRGKNYYVAWREHGQQRRQSLKTTNSVEAKRRLTMWERERIAQGGDGTPRDCEVDRFWDEYVAWMSNHLAPATIDNYSMFWNQFLDELKPAKLSDVSRARVERLKGRWLKEGRHPGTINNWLRTMKAIYNAALTVPLGEEGSIYERHNPFVGVRRIPRPKEPRRTLTTEQGNHLLEIATEHSKTGYNRSIPQADGIHLVIALGLYAGLRKKEIIAARWEWIDWDKKVVRLTQDVTFTSKTSRDRTIPLAQRLAELLEAERKEEGYIYLPDAQPITGKKYRADFRRSFSYVCEKAGVDWVTPHVLRHSFVTRLVESGVEIAKVSKWAGHSSIQVTADIYSHLTKYDSDIDRG
jgi:integrase